MTATLSSPSTRSTRPHKVRDVRRFQRIVAAVILLVPGTAVAIGRLFVTDDSDTRRALDLIAADPGRQFTFALLGFFAMLTVVPAFLAAARLARRRRPVLTMIALGRQPDRLPRRMGVGRIGQHVPRRRPSFLWSNGMAPRRSSTRCGLMGFPGSAHCSWSSATFSARS